MTVLGSKSRCEPQTNTSRKKPHSQNLLLEKIFQIDGLTNQQKDRVRRNES